jgi:hypothetical protein
VVGAAESYEPRCRACYRDPERGDPELFGPGVARRPDAAAAEAEVRIASAAERHL